MKAKPSTSGRTRRRPWPGWLNAQTVATTMLIMGVALGAAGFLLTHGPLAPALQLVEDFYANIAAELVSIAITVLIIDRLNERRSVDQEKQLLILQLASLTNSIAHEAARLLQMRGWLTDGSLQGAKLGWANLSRVLLNNADLAGADFFRVNLQQAYLAGANLTGAIKLNEYQLCQVRYLHGATLPDGRRYDGRYNLSGDRYRASEKFFIRLDNARGMADYYGVSLDVYLEGQQWAREHLSALHREWRRSGIELQGYQTPVNQRQVRQLARRRGIVPLSAGNQPSRDDRVGEQDKGLPN